MKRYVVEIRFPEMDEPIYLARLANGEYGYSYSRAGGELFDDPEIALRVATSWAPSLKDFAHAIEVFP